MGRTARTNRLTTLAIRKYAADVTATAPLHDGGGLYLRKREVGLHWSLRMTAPDGAQQWHSLFAGHPLGSFPYKSLADARAEAKRLWSARAKGIDPRAERRRRTEAQRQEASQARLSAERRITVRKLFDRWAAVELAPHVGADGRRVGRIDGGAYVLSRFKHRIFPKIGDVAVVDLRRGDLLALLDEVKAEGKLRTAHMLFSNLKQMLRFALLREIIDRNPLDTVCARDVAGAMAMRERVLSLEEIRTLASALPASTLGARFICGVWLLLATGVRSGELLGAVWAHARPREKELRPLSEAASVKLGFVDLERRTWHLTNTKNQRDHTVHLSAFAVKQFQILAELRESDPRAPDEPRPWIFPNFERTGPVDVKSLTKQLVDRQRDPEQRLARRTKATTELLLPGGRWTAHDLRRTCATLMARLGASGDVIDECLNHMIESRVRRIYVRDRRYGEQARAFDLVGELIDSLMRNSLSTQLGDADPLARITDWRRSSEPNAVADLVELPLPL